MKTRLASSLLLMTALSAPAAAQQQPADAQVEARRQVERVIDAFRTAIIDKDRARFLALFPATGPVTWQDVIADANLERLRKARPDAAKVGIDPANTPRAFIDGIVSDPKRSEETFEDIEIDTDGDIASVRFDYAFLSDGRETNRGREAWHLVRTDDGWKIVSVVWSTRWNPKTAD